MHLKTLIVDDSPAHRMLLGKMIAEHSKLQLVGDFTKTRAAKGYLEAHHVDLLFLNVEMPSMNGFDFLESLADSPMTILTTGKAEYAARAFEYDIVYYLLRPFSVSSFMTSIERAIARYTMLQRLPTGSEPYIFAKNGHKPRKVFCRTIRWIQGLGDYVKLMTDDGTVILRTTLKGIAQILPEDQFLRIHKSYIVNLTKINKFNSRMVEIENTPIPLSTKKRDELDRILAV